MNKKLIIAVVLLAAAIALYISSKNQGTKTIAGWETEFAVEDPSSITRVFISTSGGTTADLTKEKDGTWRINDNYQARPDAIKHLLESIKNLRVHSPISDKGIEPVVRKLAARHKKVELYKNNEETPFKTYFIGGAHQKLNSNIALLETRKNGRSEKPFYVEKLGHRGIIAPIFFPMEMDWMSTKVFELEKAQIASIKIDYPKNKTQSFEIVKKGDAYRLKERNKDGMVAEQSVNRFAIDQYLESYKLIHFESINTGLEPYQCDSLMDATPRAVVTVKQINGAVDSIKIYNKYGPLNNDKFEFVRVDEDPNTFHGIHNGICVKLQRFVFNKLLFKHQDFLMES